jgi:predicted nuclease of predicted toxin-antitoxin system
MKVLNDECAPRALKTFLAKEGHDCSTVQEVGWSGKQNGELLSLADGRFNVLVTLDTNFRYQQSLSSRKIAIVILKGHSNRLIHLSPHFPACLAAIERSRPGKSFPWEKQHDQRKGVEESRGTGTKRTRARNLLVQVKQGMQS